MNKKHILRLNILLSFLIFSQMLLGQNNTIDDSRNKSINRGWENLIGESTENVVREKYSSQLTILEKVGEYNEGKYYCPFEIKNYELGDYNDFTVFFIFDEKPKNLFQVNLTKELVVS